ncbi:MAG TPA: universal stress protein [Labilithrix sp.]|jgi:nucleotide-binding universal stress UspA family protein
MKRILVGVDSSKRARAVLDAAIDLARRTGSRVRLFRAVALPPELPATLWSMPPHQLLETFLASSRTEVDDLAKTVPPELFDGVTVQIGVPWDAICAAAREQDADLIVIGSHGYGLLDRVLGTTAAKVVNHADRSVLVVRMRGGEAK